MSSGTAIRLHSSYNPAREARRYIEESIRVRDPRIIVITEPGESWLAGELRERFPLASLIAVRYCRDLFVEFDSLWDAVWRPDSGVDLHSFLFNLISEEELPLTVFLPWKPADAVWPEAARGVWGDISSLLHTQISLIRTRNHFGPVWLSNSVRNAILVRQTSKAVHTGKPVLLAAAGPSLERLFPLENRERFFVIAVSSALRCALENDIRPDLCMTTDGGYWSKGHLRYLPGEVPLAYPLEASIPVRALESNPAVLLDYGSALEAALFGKAGIRGERARQCATVSGTAAYYALEHTSDKVYASGLDLAPSLSFTHCRPHSTDFAIPAKTGRFNPVSGLLYEQGRENAQMEIYARWFSAREPSFTSRFFRLHPSSRSLGTIRDIGIDDIGASVRDPVTSTTFVSPENRSDGGTRERISTWLLEVAERFASVDEGQSAGMHDALMLQLLQMVSLVDYLSYMKGERSEAEICANAARFLSRLAGKAQRYESSDT